jgi:hypothetical protein
MLSGLERGRSEPLDWSVSILLDDIRSWCGGAVLRDDISLLARVYRVSFENTFSATT